jgi:hypothetical protein
MRYSVFTQPANTLAQVLAQLAADGGVAQAAEGLGLDLADAIAGHASIQCPTP